MATILTRSHPQSLPGTSNTSSPQPRKVSRKSSRSSFLSLKKEKKPLDISSPTLPPISRGGRPGTSPSAYHPVDLDDEPRPAISRPFLRPRTSHSNIKTAGPVRDEPWMRGTSGMREGWAKGKSPQPDEDSIDFPGVGDDSLSDLASEGAAAQRARARSHTGSSRRSDWEQYAFIRRPLKYPMRDSGSSTLSQFDALPQTPVDDLSFRDPIFSLPVLVAAPVSGVETMDALVDGMNGFGSDDHFMTIGGMSSRPKVSKSGNHPLYHPPLPTPPPGVTLGPRSSRKSATKVRDSDEDTSRQTPYRASRRDRNHRPPSSRTGSNTTVTRSPIMSMSSREDISLYSNSSVDDFVATPTKDVPALPKAVVPSISEIIRAHAPASQQGRSRPATPGKTSYNHTQESIVLKTSTEVLPEIPNEEEADLISRSSVDTIAEEVRHTLRNQASSVTTPGSPEHMRPYSYYRPPSSAGHDNLKSPPSPKIEDYRASSYSYSSSTISDQPQSPPLDIQSLTKSCINSPSQAIAQYLRSSRLTNVLKLTRAPHATQDTPLSVSFSDLGIATGYPLVVFLGLGCVRHIMGLYDEMAQCLGIRLITIDRWGMGRTDSPRSKTAKGIPEWASVVEEVLDRLDIDQCSVMAHSAGAPYALAFANRFPERIRGDVCLLAPWVGGGESVAGYKWLKYVPNGILKTAQAAEWKVQAWMLGKPPTIAYEGIGFNVKSARVAPPAHSPASTFTTTSTSPVASIQENSVYLVPKTNGPRPSIGSVFSDYDDLRDFEGRFESRSTLGRRSSGSHHGRTFSDAKSSTRPSATKKPSRGFLGRLKGSSSVSQPQSPQEERSPGSGKKLKALRSMGSLKGRSNSAPNSNINKTSTVSLPPPLPIPFTAEVGLGLDDFDWATASRPSTAQTPERPKMSSDIVSLDFSVDSHKSYPRSSGRRSISFGATRSPPPVQSPPPVPRLPASPPPSEPPSTPNSSFQAALGNALIAASHAEASKGTHGDLVQILNHDRLPWGFSYTAYPHTVRVWYGDKDERIAENAVRWMESTMGPDKCHVYVVKGADHGLMYRSAVVVDVLEYISDYWRQD